MPADDLHTGSGTALAIFVLSLSVVGCNASPGMGCPNVRAWTSTALNLGTIGLVCAFGEHRGTSTGRPVYTGHFSSFHAISQNIHS